MRLFILILGSLDALLLIGAAIISLIASRHTDLAGQGMVKGYALGMLMVFLLFVLPALICAYKNKSLGLALTLVIIATLLIILVIKIW